MLKDEHELDGKTYCYMCWKLKMDMYHDEHPPDEFTKHDKGKPRLDLIPPEIIFGLGEVLAHGAEKYGDNNWATGADWHRYAGAALRHFWDWWGGEDLDKESGINHLFHAACNLAFLAAYQARGLGRDDRTKVQTNSGDK